MTRNTLNKFILLTSCVLSSSVSYAASSPFYESTEHVTAGNHVKLYFSANDPGSTSETLHLPNSIALTYGELVSMGDFYGVVDGYISGGKSADERRARFLSAFSTLAEEPAAAVEMPKILAVLQAEKKALDDGISQGEKPEDIFKRISEEDNRGWNCATGGGCTTVWWLQPGRYMQLAKEDYDHFGESAWLAYQAGHELAINKAISAHNTGDRQQLEIAYAMNAFASHFLSDRFATGHMRTPRSELPAAVTPSVIGSLLSSYMHAEENQSGLHVHNQQGSHWIAYGDRHYFNAENDENRLKLDITLQASADQIFAAYQSGSIPEDNISALLPVADEIGDDSRVDTASMFYWDSNKKELLRRADLSNTSDRHWTNNWWGWTTLILLAQQRGIPVSSQAELALSGHGKQAIEHGLITDKNIQQYITQHEK